MADHQDPRQDQYKRARDAFEDLKIEDRTIFLIKETINTIFQGVETAARSIADEFGAMFGDAPAADTGEAEAKASGNGAAKSGTKKTTRAKTRSTTKKTTSKRTSAKKADSDDT